MRDQDGPVRAMGAVLARMGLPYTYPVRDGHGAPHRQARVALGTDKYLSGPARTPGPPGLGALLHAGAEAPNSPPAK